MNILGRLLSDVKEGSMSVEQALEKLKDFGSKDLGYATIDTHRELRTGYPEVIFGQGKTPEQVAGIIGFMLTHDNNILATRVDRRILISKSLKFVPTLFTILWPAPLR